MNIAMQRTLIMAHISLAVIMFIAKKGSLKNIKETPSHFRLRCSNEISPALSFFSWHQNRIKTIILIARNVYLIPN